jgi:hypothetical protein
MLSNIPDTRSTCPSRVPTPLALEFFGITPHIGFGSPLVCRKASGGFFVMVLEVLFVHFDNMPPMRRPL